ncbi:MAG: hypothetical protein AAGI27_08545 [Pseudomonadota bacterium]
MSAVNPVAPQPPSASLLTLLASATMAILSAVLYGVMFIATPSFSRLYAGFGADLPSITALFLASGPWFLVLGILGFAPAVLFALNRHSDPGTRTVFVGASIASFLLSIFVFAAWVVATYLPIWKMGAVV